MPPNLDAPAAGQRYSLGPAPPSSPASAWVSAVAGGKEPGEGGGEAGVVAEAATATGAGTVAWVPPPLAQICATTRPN